MTKSPFEPLTDATIRVVTLKVVFLVAITSACRVSELYALSVRVSYLSVFADRIILKVDYSFLPKVCSTLHRSQEIVLPSFFLDSSDRREEAYIPWMLGEAC